MSFEFNPADPHGECRHEIERLRAENERLRNVCQMSLDAQLLPADEYERKYYPLAGPATLIHMLTAALSQEPPQP